MKKIAVICANYGDYDDIFANYEIKNKDKFDWFLFTDSNVDCSFWDFIKDEYHMNNNIEGKNSFNNLDKNDKKTWFMMAAKYYKLQSHHIPILKNYDYFIWIDSSISILNVNFVNDVIKMIENDDVELINFIHPERNNIFDEGILSIRMDKYNNQDIPKQVESYKSEGFDERSLFWCGFFCRKNNDKMNKIFDDWWVENIQKSFQDQISFPYVLWKNQKKVDIIINQSMYYNQFLGKINYPHKAHR